MKTIDDITNELLKNKSWENTNSLEELGYTFFGPLVFNYFYWLKDEIQDGDLILFNSREGYFLNQIYQHFKLKYNLPNSVYFKTSRKLSSIASFKTESDIYESFKLHRYKGTLSDLMIDRFGLEIQKNNLIVDTSIEIPNLNNFIDDILNYSYEIRSEYKSYVKNVINNNKKLYMIDSGYQGSTQYYLEKTFHLKLNGRYMTYKGNIDLKNTKGFYDFEKCNFKDNIIFFESVFTDKVGTYSGIKNGKFINEIRSENQKYFLDKLKIVNGITNYISDAFHLNLEFPQATQTLPDYIFNLMCSKNYIKNENLFTSFYHDNLYARNNTKQINRI